MGSSLWTLPKLRMLNNLYSCYGLASSGGSATSIFAYNWQRGGMTYSDKEEGNIQGDGTRMWPDETMRDFILPDGPLGESARTGALDVSREFVVDGKTFPALPGCSTYQAAFGAQVDPLEPEIPPMIMDKRVETFIRDIPSGTYTVKVQLVKDGAVVEENSSDAFTIPAPETAPPFVEVPLVTDVPPDAEDA